MTVLFEACVDSVASAIAAQAGGAGRVELCDNLVEGGTTPSAGIIAQCIERVSIPVMVMIRPRGGDFLYDDDEVHAMEWDIRVAAKLGASGVVLGPLVADGTIDAELTRRFVERARPMSVTFHRAFDMTRDLPRSLDTLLELKVDRVLTSGAATTALKGADVIASLVAAAGVLTVMAGVGVRPPNVEEIVRRTGVREVHARLIDAVPSEMRYRAGPGVSLPVTPNDYERSMTSVDAVRDLVGVLQSLS